MSQDPFANFQQDDQGNYMVPGLFGMQTITPAEADAHRKRLQADADQRVVANMGRAPFLLNRACVKCGYSERPAKVRWQLDVQNGHFPHLGQGECLLRTCRQCGYVWTEQTVEEV